MVALALISIGFLIPATTSGYVYGAALLVLNWLIGCLCSPPVDGPQGRSELAVPVRVGLKHRHCHGPSRPLAPNSG